jgi:hypothetical protein
MYSGVVLFLYNTLAKTKSVLCREGDRAFMELIILIILVVLVLVLLFGGGGVLSLPVLLVNTVVGLILIFLTNLVISPPIPINIITILISAVGGVLGWLIILILHLLGVAFV